MLRTCEWDDKLKLPVNIKFRITEIGDMVKLHSDSRDCSIEVKFGVLKRCFTYTHAHTGHNLLQGTSVTAGITIFDLGHLLMTRAWLYTALTRSRSMDQVYYMDPSVRISGLAEVKETELRARIERKIDGHKKADSDKKRRYAPSEYVDAATVMRLLRQQGGCCCHCNEEVLLQWKESAGTRDTRQFSIDRINNDVAEPLLEATGFGYIVPRLKVLLGLVYCFQLFKVLFAAGEGARGAAGRAVVAALPAHPAA